MRIFELCVANICEAILFLFVPSVPQLTLPLKGLRALHLRLHQFRHDVPRMDIDGTDGHDLLSLALSIGFQADTEHFIRRRGYGRIVDSEFLELLNVEVDSASTVVSNLSHESYVHESSAMLTRALGNALDVCVPARTFVVRRPPARWLTEDLKNRLRARNTLFKQAKRSNSLLGYLRYKHFRNQLNSDIRRAKNEFLLASLDNISDPAKLWRELARLGSRQIHLWFST